VAAIARTIYFFVLAAVLSYAAAKVVPVVVTSFRFAQAMQAEVLHGPVNEPASTIHRRLVGDADRLGLEIPPEALLVEKRGAALSISARYVAHVEVFRGFAIDWPVDQHYQGTRRSSAGGGRGP
jgi:hypothetical protein